MKRRLISFALLLSVLPIAAKPITSQGQGVPQQLQNLAAEIAALRAALEEGVKATPPRFYLSTDTFDGAHALAACSQGFHMASLWEIFDPTNLKYDTTLGQT